METIEKIKDKIPGMTPLQKKIGFFIIDNIDKVAFMSISKLAELNRVSDSTIFKFTKLLGYEGYIDFTKNIQESIHNRLVENKRADFVKSISAPEDTTTLHEKIVTKEINNLLAFRNMVHTSDIDKCVTKLINADYISVVGMISGSGISYLFSHMLMQLFPDVTHISNLDVHAYSALNRLTEKSVVFMIAFPHYPMIIGDLAKSMKKKQVFQIGITSSSDSPVAEYADVLVTTPLELSAVQNSLVVPLTFMNIIIAGLLEKVPERFDSKLQNYNKYFTDFYNLMHKF